MDDEFKDLEAELKRLRPRAPSAELQARLASELAPRWRRANANWAWAALPLAAAFAVLVAVKFRPSAPPTQATEPATLAATPALTPAEVMAVNEPVPTYKPVAAEKVLYDSRDDGIITLANGERARRVRNAYVDTITWRDPQSKASLRWSVPRNEVRVVPVSFQ